MHDLTATIRNYINRPRMQYLLLKEMGRWHLLTSSLDVIEDAELAIAACGRLDSAARNSEADATYRLELGVRYLVVYGLLQALIVQQDAAFHLCEALDVPCARKNFPKLTHIRDIRNISIGHPTKVDRPKHRPVSHHFISRVTLSPSGFHLLSVADDDTTSFQDVALVPLIRDQQGELSRLLTEVITELEQKEVAHTAEFRGEQLSALLPETLTYAFEKISTAVRGRGERALGTWGIETVDQAVNDLRAALNRRGFEPGALEVVDLVFDQLRYPIDHLKRYLHQEASDISTTETARIFTSYIAGKLKELKQLAEEIDESYGAPENPAE